LKEVRAEYARADWRPIVAYTDNLLRIGDALLGAYDASDQYDALMTNARSSPSHGGASAGMEDDYALYSMYEAPSPRWPWYWSALVLLALGGVSLWILTTRVKTMDRLR